MAITAAVVGSVAAVTTAGIGVANYVSQQKALDAQKALEQQQKDALAKQQSDAAALAAKEAAIGSTFGFSGGPDALMTGFGFGSAKSGAPNTGRNQIVTGMG